MADITNDSSFGNTGADIGSSDEKSKESLENKDQAVKDQPSLASSSSYDNDDKDLTNKSESEPSAKEETKSTLEKLADNVKDTSEWGWNAFSSWSTSVLSTATSSVTTFTSQVGEGLQQVLETMESKLTEPEGPGEDIAPGGELSAAGSEPVQKSHDQASDQNLAEDIQVIGAEASLNPVEEGSGKQGWFGAWGASLSEVVSKTTSVVQQTVEQTTSVSKKVMSSGLDVLETIGKRTYDALSEGDPGLKKTLEGSRKTQTNLSQSLREAKEEAEEKAKLEDEFLESRKCHYVAQFDDFQGLVHLEALEMLSRASDSRVRSLSDVLSKDSSGPLVLDLTQIKLTFEETDPDNDIDDQKDDHDFHQLLMDYVGRLGLNVSVQKLIRCQESTRQWLVNYDKDTSGNQPIAKEVHEKAIQSMAEFTAYSIEHFHRSGHLLLQDKTIPATLYPTMAQSLASLTKVLLKEITWQSTFFVNCLTATAAGQDQPLTETMTSVSLESSNSSSYIQNSFQLLLPIIQLATIQAHPSCQGLTED